MIRVFTALLGLAFGAQAQATCLFAKDSKPTEWYAWAKVLVAADVAAVNPAGRHDVVTLRVVETFKGPAGLDTATLEVPTNLWEACRLERPAVGARVLGALNANNDALVVPLAEGFAGEMRAARSGPAIPIAKDNIQPAPGAAAAAAAPAAPIAMRCVAGPVYGATVKVESCEQAQGAMYLRGEVLRVAQENSAAPVEGLQVPAAGKRYFFYKANGSCQDFSRNASLTGSLSTPCCDANQPYCARKTDFLVRD